MHEAAFVEIVEEICRKDPRFEPEAYVFVKRALDFTIKQLDKDRKGAERHVTAIELLDGIKSFALQEFGPMTLTVLHEWRITRTDDFGEIVFNMVETGTLGKTEEDKKKWVDRGCELIPDLVSGYGGN